MRLLERDRELAAAQALVDRAVAWCGRVAGDRGPAGDRQDGPLEETAGRARAAGVALRLVQATRLGAELPFALARWLLEPAVRAAPSVLEAGWARHMRSLFEGKVSAVVDRRSLIEGLVALVAELRHAGGPLALIVDDAQWGDPASLEFLGELSARCEDLGVAFALAIGTAHGGIDKSLLGRLAAGAGSRTLAPAPLIVLGLERGDFEDPATRCDAHRPERTPDRRGSRAPSR
jgi:hypothetical protein